MSKLHRSICATSKYFCQKFRCTAGPSSLTITTALGATEPGAWERPSTTCFSAHGSFPAFASFKMHFKANF